MLEKSVQSRVGRALGVLALMVAVLGGGAWGLNGAPAFGVATSGLAQDGGARGVFPLAEQLEAHAAGGGFVLVEGAEGEIVCREATPEEAVWMQRRDPTVPLHVISPLRTSQQQTGLRIILRATPQLEQFPQAKAAFLRAAQTWERLIRNPITLVLDVDFGPTRFGEPYPQGVIGSTGTQEIGGRNAYPDVRAQLLRGASSQEAVVYNALPQGQVPTDLGPTAAVFAPSAVFRALGLIPPVADPDGERSRFGDPPSIGFNSNIPFDFNPDDGIDPDKIDFDAAAVHEIGHALGFASEVGVRELNPSAPVAVSVWDLFRFRPGVTLETFSTRQRILSSGGEQIFFAGPPELPLSTGRPDGSGGDGQQASHWKDDALTGQYIGIMDPTATRGRRGTITGNDLRALDFMGYQMEAQAQPPPSGDVVDLTSGVPQRGSIPAPSGGGVLGSPQYRIQVPAGATQLRVQLQGDQDVDLYVRFGQKIEIQGGRAVADYISESPTGTETITVTPSSSPPLREGAYFIAVANFGPGAATFTVTATVSGGQPPAQPDIDVQPTALDFGNVTVGSMADRTLTVRNVGNAPLTVTGMSIDNPRFTVVSPSAPFTVSAGGQQAVTVRFAPTAVGAQNGTLRLQSNDPDEATVTVSLTGQGVAAQPPPSGRTLSVPNASGEPGRTVTIAVNLSEGSGISALSFTLSFDPAVLSISGPSAVSRGSLVPDAFSLSANAATAGQVRIVISPPLTSPLPTFRSGSGSVVTIAFQVAAGATPGTTSPLALSGVSASDANANAVPITPQNGTFTVGVVRTLAVADVQGAAGATVSIPITLSEGAGLSALQFTLGFDAAILTPAANPVALGSLVPSTFTVSANTAPGQITVVISPPLTSPLPTFNSGSGTVVTLTFQVASSAAPGATSSLTLSNISASDRNANPIAVTGQNGRFTVLAVRRGDINQDGAINVQDLILLIRHLTGESPLTGTALQAADVNGDGQVNVQDVVRLIQHLTGERPLAIGSPVQTEAVRDLPTRWVTIGERFWSEGVIVVPIVISDAAEVAGAEVVIEYEATKIRPAGDPWDWVRAEWLPPGFQWYAHEVKPGRLRLVLVPPLHAPLPMLPGEMRALAHLRFAPVPGVQWQDLETASVRVRRLVLADREGRPIPAKGEP